nr:MAG TPA: hypothetical protein [Caudoviricetes sp.]
MNNMYNYDSGFTDYLENIIFSKYRLLHEADDDKDEGEDVEIPPAPEEQEPPAPEPAGDDAPEPPAPEEQEGENIEIPDDPQAPGSDDSSGQSSDNTGDNKDGQNNDSQNSDDSEKKDNEEDNEKKASEEALYKTLTGEQKKVREYKLKTDYRTLYDTIVTTIDGINDIPKTTENIGTLQRLLELLSKIKQILIGYMDYNFDNNSYIENYSMYLKYVAVFRTVSKVINELNVSKLKQKNLNLS